MTPNTAHDAGTVFGGISIGTGLLTWIDANSNALGVVIAATSALAYITFMALNWITVRSQVKSKENIKRDVIEDLIDKADEDEKLIIKRVAGK